MTNGPTCVYFTSVKLFRRVKVAREAIRKELDAEALEKARKILSSDDLTAGLIEKFLRACPYDTEIAIYPASGGSIRIYRTSYRSQEAELPRGKEW